MAFWLSTLLLLLSSVAFAQEVAALYALIEDERRFQKSLSEEEAFRAKQLKFLKQETQELAEKRQKLKVLEEEERRRPEVKARTLNEINQALKGLPLWQKAYSKHKSLFNCLKKGVERDGYIRTDNCQSLHPAGLSAPEEAKLKSWQEQLGTSPQELAAQKKSLQEGADFANSRLKSTRQTLALSEARLKSGQEALKRNKLQQDDLSVLVNNPKVMECGRGSPEINLENKKPFKGAKFKGPFHGVPRDNQDGLGTCYANTARNLLVGVSGGKADPSFLDLALLYKASHNELSKSGLDGGLSCAVIREVAAKGFCPQQFAPLESGKSNPLFESLLGKGKSSLEAQGSTLFLLKNFMRGLEKLEGKESASADLLKRGEELLVLLKANSKIKLPLPMVRYEVPPEFIVIGAFKALGNPSDAALDQFMGEYDRAYSKFYPSYVKAVVEGKNPEQVFAIYQNEMGPFLRSKGLGDKLGDFKRAYLSYVKDEFNQPDFQKSLKDSLEFLAKLTGKNVNDRDFIEYCANQYSEGLEFVGKLAPLMAKLDSLKVDPKLLLDEKGKFRSSAELMQLAVAPACVNPENRKRLSFDVHCDDGSGAISAIKNSGKSDSEKFRMFRGKVASSLLQGFPLGNSFPTGPGSRHINTIVGMRYNKKTDSCEYRIRESQTGTSSWQSEDGIFQKIDALTVVRRH